MSTWVAIFDLGGAGFWKEHYASGPQPVFLSYLTETKVECMYVDVRPPGGFWVALVFERNLPLVDLNSQKYSDKSK
jgi:hypothetical protein